MLVPLFFPSADGRIRRGELPVFLIPHSAFRCPSCFPAFLIFLSTDYADLHRFLSKRIHRGERRDRGDFCVPKRTSHLFDVRSSMFSVRRFPSFSLSAFQPFRFSASQRFPQIAFVSSTLDLRLSPLSSLPPISAFSFSAFSFSPNVSSSNFSFQFSAFSFSPNVSSSNFKFQFSAFSVFKTTFVSSTLDLRLSPLSSLPPISAFSFQRFSILKKRLPPHPVFFNLGRSKMPPRKQNQNAQEFLL